MTVDHLVFVVYVGFYFSLGEGQPCPTQPYRIIYPCNGTRNVAVIGGLIIKMPGSAEHCDGSEGPAINCSVEITAEPGQKIIAISLFAFIQQLNACQATLTFSESVTEDSSTYCNSTSNQVLYESTTNQLTATYRGPAHFLEGPFIQITVASSSAVLNIGTTSSTRSSASQTFSTDTAVTTMMSSSVVSPSTGPKVGTTSSTTSSTSQTFSPATAVTTVIQSSGVPIANQNNISRYIPSSSTPGNAYSIGVLDTNNSRSTYWNVYKDWIIGVTTVGCLLTLCGITARLLIRRKYLSLLHQPSGTAPSSQQTDRDQPYEEVYNGQVQVNLSEANATNHISAFGNPITVVSSSVYIHLKDRSIRDNHVYDHIEDRQQNRS